MTSSASEISKRWDNESMTARKEGIGNTRSDSQSEAGGFLELLGSPISVATFTALCLVESTLFLWSRRPCTMHRETSHPLSHWMLRTWRIWRRRRCRAHMSSCCSSRTLTTSSKSQLHITLVLLHLQVSHAAHTGGLFLEPCHVPLF